MKVCSLNKITPRERSAFISKNDHDNFFYIQVGANDGINSDNFKKDLIAYDHWNGIMIEPHPEEFKKLQKNIKNPNTLFENCAICNKDELVNFHIAHDSRLSSLLLTKSELKKTIEINGMRWDSLLRKHGIENPVDLVHIDAEGFDYHIVNQILTSMQPLPTIIEFECNFRSNQSGVEKTFQKLVNKGYAIYHYRIPTALYDCFAILK
jgi:FkbM family methyltransferase